MRQETSVFNKALAFLLCVFVMLSSSNLSAITYAKETEATATVTEAELVASNYESLSSAEKAILNSGLLKSRTLTYPIPSASDNLISVDADTRTLTAAAFEKDGYVWNPVSAEIVYSGGRESVELTAGAGTFTYDGTAYTVEVKYELYITVDEETQRGLLNAPQKIARLYDNGDTVDYHYGDFDTIALNIDALVSLTDGSLPFGTHITHEETCEAIRDLKAQTERNKPAGSEVGLLDIEVILGDYEQADSKMAYLLVNGRALKAETEKIFNQISLIMNEPDIQQILKVIGNSHTVARKVRVVLNSLNAMYEDIEPVVNDEWAMLRSNPLKDGLTAEDYATLDSLAAAAKGAAVHEDAIKDKLFAASTVIESNVNQCTVKVIVSASVIKETAIDDATPTSLGDHTAEIRLREGSTAAEVLAAIAENGIEADSIAAWGEIDTVNYVRTADELTGELVSDITYRIKYMPKDCTVTYDFTTDLPATVPYGYNMTMPLHEGTEKVYDYKVNGKAYLQGEIVRITGNTEIKRTENKPWDVQSINKLVASNYKDLLTPAEIAVLEAVALKGEYILLRSPDDSDNLVTITAGTGGASATDGTETYTVVAQKYASGLNGLLWQASKGRAILGTDVVREFTFTDGEATFTSVPFDRAEIDYVLVIDNATVTNDQVLDVLNLPGILATQAADQKDNIEILNGLYSKLGQLTKATLNQIKFGVGGSDMSDEAKAAVDAILNGCVDNEASQLYLYVYLTEYRKSGLTYYYQSNNYLRIRNQVEILNANLTTIYNDPEFMPLLQDIEYEEYYDRIGDIIADLSRVTLSDPHEAINTASPSLAELVAAIESITTPHTFGLSDISVTPTSAGRQLTITKTLNAAAPQRAFVSITVQAKNSVGDVIKSATSTLAFPTTSALTAADIASLEALIATLKRDAAIDTLHYETADTLGIAPGETLADNVNVTITYTPKEYTSKFVDETGTEVGRATFKYDVPTITLPACNESGLQYRYTVCGVQVIVGSEAKDATFTSEQIDSGEYETILRETIDVYRDNTLELVDEINDGASEAGLVDGASLSAAIIPLQDADGNLILVFRLSPKNFSQFAKFIQQTAEALSASDFTHIKLGDDFLREDSLISLQAVINAVLNSGMSIDTILDAVKADGSINEMTLSGATVIGADAQGNITVSGGNVIPETDKLGGKIMETTMRFGVSRNDTGITAKLYITIEDFGNSTDNLKRVRDLASKARARGNVILDDGIAYAEATIPDRAYQAYISAMIALGNTSLKDLDQIDMMPLKELVLKIAEFIAGDETITTDTYENTADKVNKDIDLDKYSDYYSKARRALNHILNNITINPDTETASTNEYLCDVTYDLTALFDRMNLADSFRKMIKERDTGVEVSIKVKINNTNDYDALVIDPGAKGTAKVVYTRDLAAALRSAHNNTAIILLGDYDGDVTIRKQSLLDLNGHKINGNLTCDARTLVIDSTLASDSNGGVTGTVSGSAIITAGSYRSDVSSKLKTGYALENGKVKNLYYYIEVVPSRGGEVINVHLTPDVETIKAQDKNGLKAIAAEVASDLVLNYYMCAALKIGGNEIYAANFNDILGYIDDIKVSDVNEVLDGINCAGITALANDILAKVTDLGAAGRAIQLGNAVASYTIEYQPATFELEHVVNGDYLTANIMPNPDNTQTQTINFYVDNNDGLGNVLSKLADIMTIDAEVELEDVYYDPALKDIVTKGNGSIEVTVDLTGDTNFAIAVGVLLANATNDAAKRDALIAGINEWYDTGYVTADLKAAVEAMTTEELLDAFDTDDSFESMVAALGLDGTVEPEVNDLYNTYRKVIKGAFKVIHFAQRYTVRGQGSATTLAAFETEYGVYSDERTNVSRERSFDVRGEYGVTGIATVTLAKFTVKLFVEDIPFQIKVLDKDGVQVWEGRDLVKAFDEALDGYTIVVSDEVELEADVELDREVKLEGAQFVTFGTYKIILTDPDASKLVSDEKITDSVASCDETSYKLIEEQDAAGNYVYTLEVIETYKIIVTLGAEILYKGDDLNAAFAATEDGCLITILEDVVLAADAQLDCEAEIVGAQFIDFAGHNIVLTDPDASKLTVDEAITANVASGDPAYGVEATSDTTNGTVVYTLKYIETGDKLVYRISPKNAYNLASIAKEIGNAISESDYTIINIDGEDLRNGSTIYLQAAVDAILNSGMSLDTILSAINEDGTINEMTLAGATVIGTDADGNINLDGYRPVPVHQLGALLMQMPLVLKKDNGETKTMTLYVTLEDFGEYTSQLSKVRKLAAKLRPYGNITLHDGMVDAEGRMPDRMYQAYISAMIALGNSSLQDLEKADISLVKDFAESVIRFFAEDETITTTTFENTIAKFGKDVDLSEYADLYAKARRAVNHLLNNLTIDSEMSSSNEYRADFTYDLTAVLNRMNLSNTLRRMIAESDTGIIFGARVKITNTADYDALVIDPGARRTAKVVYTRDLAATLDGAHKNTAVILLRDIDGDITVHEQSLLDLNGHVINGSLTCEARTLVIDSSLATVSGAGVTGTVSGNAIITAGKYNSDVSAMLKTGYTQESGQVKNLYYYIEVIPSRGNEVVNVHLTPDVETLKDQDKNGLKAIAAEIAADFALNYFNVSAALKIGGYEIYTAQFNDIVGMIEDITADDVNAALDCINCADITALANDILGKLTDLASLSSKIKAGEAIATYDVETQPWTFELDHIVDGDYLTVNVLANDNNTKAQTFNVFVDDNDGLSGMLAKLAEIMTIDAEVELEDIFYNGPAKDVVGIGNGSLDVTIDLTGSPNYAIAIGLVLANGTEDAAKREAIVDAIKVWYETGYRMADLKAAIEEVTTKELLEAFDTSDSFEAMVTALGLDGIVEPEVNDLYNSYRKVIKAAFKAIDYVHKFTNRGQGSSNKLGLFETSEYGVYQDERVRKTIKRTFEVRGDYGVTGVATAELLRLTVKLFTEDEQFPIIVLDTEGKEIWHGDDLNKAFAQALDGYTIVVSDNVELKANVELDREVKLEGGEYVDFGEYTISLTDAENSKFIIDVQITDTVVSGVENYEVDEAEDEDGNYVYTLKEIPETYKIIVLDAEGNEVWHGDELNTAFEKALDGYTIKILEDVALTANVELDHEVTVVGGEHADFGEYTITLTDAENSKLTIDVQITDTVVSGVEDYEVDEAEDEDGNYVYTLKEIPYKIIVTLGEEVLYKGDDLNAAFAAATEGSLITILDDVALTANVELDHAVTVVGGEHADFGEYTITLTDAENSKLTIDVQITDTVVSGVEDYEVDEAEDEDGNYVYTLKEIPYKIIVTLGEEVLYKGDDLNAAFAAATEGSLITILDDVALTANVELDHAVTVVGGEHADFGEYTITLTDAENSKLTIDVQITDTVVSGVENYEVDEAEDEDGNYVYTLKEIPETYKIIVTLGEEVLYKGDDLNAAFAAATEGSLITILDNVALTESIELDHAVTVVGGEYADFGEYTITLTDVDNSKLTIDKQITGTVTDNGDPYYVIEAADEDGNYVYTLGMYKIIVTNGDEVLYRGDDLNEAFAAATEGSTITVYGEVALAEDVELDHGVTVVGGEFIDFGGHTITLTGEDAKLTIDKQITDTVVSTGDPYFVVEEAGEDGNYVYTLDMYKIIVTNGDEVLYKGNDLNEAFAAATEGSTITVYGEVALAEDVELDHGVTVVGGEFIDFGGHTITLTGEDAELTIDKQITETVKSNSEYSEVTETANEDGTYTYTLSPMVPEVHNPAVTGHEPIVGFKVDNENGIIILDIVDPASYTDLKLAGNGITAAQFKEYVTFTYANTENSQVKVTFNGAELADGALVPTGTKVTVTATNPDYNGVVTKEYDVVILGDTNCNGRIDSGDAKLMLDHYFDINKLTGLRLIAADTNCSGGIESGDAVKNTVKYNRPKEYESDLNDN